MYHLYTPSLAFRGVRAFPTLTPYALLGAMLTVMHENNCYYNSYIIAFFIILYKLLNRHLRHFRDSSYK
uniref:Uncharacterized protein n=1 Tax=Lactococcus lactis subsp. lactis TaxID=1360 RepID=A0A1V0NYK2_LACLL